MTDRFVLLPGLHGTDELFRPFVDALPASSEVAVVSYPRDRALGYAELEPWVGRAVPAVPYVLVAESFSGPLAVVHAAANPPNLRAVVLCATFVSNPVPWILRWIRFVPWRIVCRIAPPRALVRALLTGADCEPALVDAVIGTCASVQSSVIAHRLAQVFDADVAGLLSAVSVPVLYLAGSQDRLVGSRGLRQVSRRLPGLCSVPVDGPHLLLQCRPHECVREITEFIAHGRPDSASMGSVGHPSRR